MIRQPSLTSALYAWHRAAVAGKAPPQHEGDPQCGWYRTRLVRGGPWVPARIWIEREIDPYSGELLSPEVFRCEIDGQRRDPYRVWTYITPIPREEYDALIARRASIPAMKATLAKIDVSQTPMRPF